MENKMYRKSLDLLSDHVRKVQDAVRTLVSSFDDFLSGNIEPLKAEYISITTLEEEADVLKLELIDQLTKVAPGLLYREDFLRLVVKIDEVAEIAQSISRLLVRLAENKWIPNSSVGEGLKTLGIEVLMACERLRDVVMALSTNPRHAIQLVGEVHMLEARVDRIYQDLDFKVLMEIKQYERLLIYRDLLGLLEHMVDTMEEASDDARVLALHRVA
jgi:predicted phosphate transport protein (TIGR00153 family)